MTKKESMTGETSTQIDVNSQAFKRIRKNKNKSDGGHLGPVTIDIEALRIFMSEDYKIRHPFMPYDRSLPPKVNYAREFEWYTAGQSEWDQMSQHEKAPFIQKVMEKKAPTPPHLLY